MGMAASQARFLSLTARKSNVEYEGQQVNQERTALANESANLYNQLNSIEVPTPPSTSDYYTTTYTFTSSDLSTSSGSTTEYSLSDIYTNADGTYATLAYTTYAWKSALSGSYSGNVNGNSTDGYSVNLANGSTYNATEYTYQPTNVTIDLGDLTSAVNVGDVTFALDGETGAVTQTDSAGNTYSYNVTKNADGTYSLTLSVEEQDTEDSYYVSIAGSQYQVTKNSDGTYSCTITEEGSSVTGAVSGAYYDADGNTSAAISYLSEDSLSTTDTTTGSTIKNQPILGYEVDGQTYYISAEEFASRSFSGSYYIANVGTTQYKDFPCTYTTASSGRYQTISITDDTGNTYTYSLNVETVEDEEAYEQAMLDYEYEQAVYNKKIQDINAQTESIQQQDRTLELRLQQLDTEQNALATEMEAVEKVIEDNIEATFNTFA